MAESSLIYGRKTWIDQNQVQTVGKKFLTSVVGYSLLDEKISGNIRENEIYNLNYKIQQYINQRMEQYRLPWQARECRPRGRYNLIDQEIDDQNKNWSFNILNLILND
jgi:hypothetical protein